MDDKVLSKSSTLADEVFDQIRTAIVEGELAPGSKVNEPQLSKHYGISRGPLREAIRRLEGCKLVEIKPNVGAKVVSLNREQAIEIYEIREALEGVACRLAATRAGTEDCTRLRELLAHHEQQIQSDNGRRYFQKEGDLDFHYLIVQLSSNTRLFNLLCGELYHLQRLYRCQTSSEPLRPEQAFKEHHQIVDAIENHDGELAELLMKRHISRARETLVSQLNQIVMN
ncbi:MAG: GntR family transcriptional regulator [Gammaproteobacteria bacterium]|jgi:DNA-binding GntR family transcriptional regulator|nr:GntR family transcriptional regulator [Gammaproteobacteria bacterium]MDP6534891.1 GntR family transcriptional regulator [Gammaproteobacteria bacterium]MDP6731968.1 GntR family transcriptional regulator [Gammaproteobacteria bacterium]HAJ75638.1 GntR family transcriptional regulator [Gammaproteobacteria bacterium]|tara:strand:+ start:1398 stop:2078 length:681 start_codon:yes stop_codon:yes gene_type:complete